MFCFLVIKYNHWNNDNLIYSYITIYYVLDIIADQKVSSLELDQISEYTVDCAMGTCDTERMSLMPAFEKMRDSFAEIIHAKSGGI